MYLNSLFTAMIVFGGAVTAVPSPFKMASAATMAASTSSSFTSVTATKAAPIVYATPAYDGGYQNTVLKHHNVHRANHSAAALTWGHLLAEWAEVLASRCVFAHNT